MLIIATNVELRRAVLSRKFQEYEDRAKKWAYQAPERNQLGRAKLAVLGELLKLSPGETLDTNVLKQTFRGVLGSFFCERDYDMAALVVWCYNEGREDLLRK